MKMFLERLNLKKVEETGGVPINNVGSRCNPFQPDTIKLALSLADMIRKAEKDIPPPVRTRIKIPRPYLHIYIDIGMLGLRTQIKVRRTYDRNLSENETAQLIYRILKKDK